MKNALWLFLYLLLHADRMSGFLTRKIKTICTDMGIPRDTIIRWLSMLRKGGYITTENTGRCLHIQITKWKNLSDAGNLQFQKKEESDLYGWKNPTGKEVKEYPKTQILREKPDISFDANDRTIKKDILKNDNDDEIFQSNLHASKGTKPRNRHDQVALDMATALNDCQNLPLYQSYSRKYPESLLWKVLSEVKQIPTGKIKKSRGALFNYLVQRYVPKSSHNLGN
jgi:hypothetical protein